MARYSVWVSHPSAQDRIEVHSGDDADTAAEEVYSLVAHSGAASFDVGISIGTDTGVMPPTGTDTGTPVEGGGGEEPQARAAGVAGHATHGTQAAPPRGRVVQPRTQQPPARPAGRTQSHR